MTKWTRWSRFIAGVAAMLLVYAPIIPLNGCAWFLLGEPQLPNKLLQK